MSLREKERWRESERKREREREREGREEGERETVPWTLKRRKIICFTFNGSHFIFIKIKMLFLFFFFTLPLRPQIAKLFQSQLEKLEAP